MHRSLTSALLTCVVVSLATGAAAQNRPVDVPAARTSQGGALTLPSTASPRAVLAHVPARPGPQPGDRRLARRVQRAARAAGRHACAVRAARRRSCRCTAPTPRRPSAPEASWSAVIENLVSVPARVTPGADQRAAGDRGGHGQSLSGASHRAGRILPQCADRDTRGDSSRRRDDDRGVSRRDVDRQGNQLNESLVDGDGAVLDVESRTNNDSYNVFRINPNVTRRRPSSLALRPAAPRRLPAGCSEERRARRTSPATTPTPISTRSATTSRTRGGVGDRRTASSWRRRRSSATPSTSEQSRGGRRRTVLSEQPDSRRAVPPRVHRGGAAIFRRTTSARAAAAATRSTPKRRTAAAPTTPTSRRRVTARIRACRCTSGPAAARHTRGRQSDDFRAQGAEFGPALTSDGVTGTIVAVATTASARPPTRARRCPPAR